MTGPRTLALEAHEELLAREALEGDGLEQLWRAADGASRRTGRVVGPEVGLWLQVELALERHRRAPGDGRHLRDAVVHLALLARLEAVSAAGEAAEAPTGAWQGRAS